MAKFKLFLLFSFLMVIFSRYLDNPVNLLLVSIGYLIFIWLIFYRRIYSNSDEFEIKISLISLLLLSTLGTVEKYSVKIIYFALLFIAILLACVGLVIRYKRTKSFYKLFFPNKL